MLKKLMFFVMAITLLITVTACGGGGGGSGEELSEKVYTGSDLGCTYTSGSAILKLWAPNAGSVKVNLYDKNNQDTAVTTAQNIAMTKDETTGVWSVELNSENTGKQI